MLYTRTKRAAAAVTLGIGGVLAASASNAQIYYAQEALTAEGATTKGGETYYDVTMPSGTEAELIFPLAGVDGVNFYVRVDFGNLRVDSGNVTFRYFNVDAQDPDGKCDTTAGNAVDATFVASDNDGTSAVYSLGSPLGSGYRAGWCIRGDLQTATSVEVQSGAITAKAMLYTSYRDALFGTPDAHLVSTNTATVAVVESVVSGNVSPLTAATASVERGFAAFTGASPNKASLATVTVAAKHNKIPAVADDPDTPLVDETKAAVDYRNAAGVALTADTAAALVKSAQVDFTGDFSPGTFTLAGAADSGCPDKGALAMNADKTELAGTMTGVGACTFAMDVTANATAEAKGEAYVSIKKQKITADLAITLATDKPAYGFTTKTDQPAGEIKRDGTTVHLPYLTTAPGYAQELLIVNRGARDAELWLDAVASDGTDPASRVSSAAPETLAKESTQTLAVTDLVDLGEGGEEGSATLSINAASRNVDVLTILTNQATGSTDTVQHAPEPL